MSHGGIIGVLEGNIPGKTLILRAGMEALPMKEAETNSKSLRYVFPKNNTAAHMCGQLKTKLTPYEKRCQFE